MLPLNCSDYAELLEMYLNRAVDLYQSKLQTVSISMGKDRTVREEFTFQYVKTRIQ